MMLFSNAGYREVSPTLSPSALKRDKTIAGLLGCPRCQIAALGFLHSFPNPAGSCCDISASHRGPQSPITFPTAPSPSPHPDPIPHSPIPFPTAPSPSPQPDPILHSPMPFSTARSHSLQPHPIPHSPIPFPTARSLPHSPMPFPAPSPSPPGLAVPGMQDKRSCAHLQPGPPGTGPTAAAGHPQHSCSVLGRRKGRQGGITGRISHSRLLIASSGAAQMRPLIPGMKPAREL